MPEYFNSWCETAKQKVLLWVCVGFFNIQNIHPISLQSKQLCLFVWHCLILIPSDHLRNHTLQPKTVIPTQKHKLLKTECGQSKRNQDISISKVRIILILENNYQSFKIL